LISNSVFFLGKETAENQILNCLIYGIDLPDIFGFAAGKFILGYYSSLLLKPMSI